jgi:hypothetical protein
MSKKQTLAVDIETKGDPKELAKNRSIDAKRADSRDPKERKEQDDAAAIANASSQTGQT